MEIEGIKKQ